MNWLYSARRQWLLIFGYACVAMYAMRTYFIPALAAHQEGHLGGDPFFYHNLAIELANRIRAHGMGAWTLHVEGQGPAGVMALVYLVTQAQFGVVVLNAILHATASLCIILILRRFFTPIVATLSALPFIVSPFQMFWFSQINKDSYVACGFMLFTMGLLHATDEIRRKVSGMGLLTFMLLSGAGAMLIYVGRPFIVFLVQYIAILTLVVTLAVATLLRTNNQPLRQTVLYTVFLCLFLTSLSPLTKGAASDETLTNLESTQIPPGQMEGTQIPPGQIISILPQYPVANVCLSNSLYGWETTKPIPTQLDAKLKALFSQRCLYFIQLYDPNPTTRYAVLDSDIYPRSLTGSLTYLPRAIMNGFLAPFPWSIVDHFGLKTSTFFTMAPLEVAFFLLTIPFLVGWLFHGRPNRAAVLVPVALSASVVVVYGLGVPFMGALYRYRYPFWMLIFCISLAATLTFFNSHLRRKPEENVI